MTEVKIASRTVPDEFGRPRHLPIMPSPVRYGRNPTLFPAKTYGVRISEESGDTAAIPGITTSAVRIEEPVDPSWWNTGVSPTALPDVISDWL